MSEFISLYSGSSGNSSVVRCGAHYLIVDMGKGVRTTTAALKQLGLSIADCDGILVTHEHRIHTPDEKTMTIATDLGVLTPPVHEALSGCDLVALESNYDLRMLRTGPYPYYLRARIESARGHLSNDECSAKLLELVQEGCKKFALCHLSQENNTPQLALQTVFNTLGAAGVVPEKDCIVQAQRRNEVSPALEF